MLVKPIMIYVKRVILLIISGTTVQLTMHTMINSAGLYHRILIYLKQIL